MHTISATGLNAAGSFGAASIGVAEIPSVAAQRLLLPHNGVVVRAQLVRDDYGGELNRDWAQAERWPVKCLIVGKKTSELMAGAERSDTYWELLGAHDMDIQATDRFEFYGLTAQVDGEPFVWTDHRGNPHHTQVLLRWIEG